MSAPSRQWTRYNPPNITTWPLAACPSSEGVLPRTAQGIRKPSRGYAEDSRDGLDKVARRQFAYRRIERPAQREPMERKLRNKIRRTNQQIVQARRQIYRRKAEVSIRTAAELIVQAKIQRIAETRIIVCGNRE